jgi:hypothetical protein
MGRVSRLSRAARMMAAACVATTLFGCAAVKLPPPTATGDTVQQLRTAGLPPLKAGTFSLAPGRNPEMDRVQGGLRGSTVSAEGGSFAQYLREVVVAELKAAGLYDENSKTQIGAQLTDSQLDAAIGTGTGRLAARFSVQRDGKTVYDKELSVEDRWESSFAGPVALPEAINHYGRFYKQLAARLFKDPEFRQALAK